MGEFTRLSQELIPIFAQIKEIKERYGITSLSLESFHTIDQFYGSHGGKNDFIGYRQRDRSGNLEIPFMSKK